MQNWTFTYIGTDHDVESFALSVSITNTMKYEKTPEDIKDMFLKEASARFMYSERIKNKKETGKGFYDEDKKKS
jgi:hypothetical protein